MAIKAPGWCKDAVPTLRGWEDPNTGELLTSSRHTQAQLDEWHGGADASAPEVLIEAMPESVDDDEDEYEYYDLGSMSKKELEDLGRDYGIELDRRKSKADLIEELEAVMDEE